MQNHVEFLIMAGLLLLPLPVGLDGTTQTRLGSGRVMNLELPPVYQVDIPYRINRPRVTSFSMRPSSQGRFFVFPHQVRSDESDGPFASIACNLSR